MNLGKRCLMFAEMNVPTFRFMRYYPLEFEFDLEDYLCAREQLWAILQDYA